MTREIEKHPDAVLDYTFDWSGWLEDGETITSADVSVNGVVKVSDSVIGGAAVVVWVSGGTHNTTASISCKITTSNTPARRDTRKINLPINEDRD